MRPAPHRSGISCFNRHPRRSLSNGVNTLIDRALSTSISVLQQSSCSTRATHRYQLPDRDTKIQCRRVFGCRVHWLWKPIQMRAGAVARANVKRCWCSSTTAVVPVVIKCTGFSWIYVGGSSSRATTYGIIRSCGNLFVQTLWVLALL